jgi:hypothetical protein
LKCMATNQRRCSQVEFVCALNLSGSRNAKEFANYSR